ncbi:hypothetical protein DPX16_17928 [Anabarilius grahami]|uniref:Uncharacterized protein n=1 Tax=Anabarilius grahami TaxID=495550 RepID=A0A3N0XSV6_ANAGA|nr:hypothetical protein DPX16_17928 [Anabarilius grahami]
MGVDFTCDNNKKRRDLRFVHFAAASSLVRWFHDWLIWDIVLCTALPGSKNTRYVLAGSCISITRMCRAAHVNAVVQY